MKKKTTLLVFVLTAIFAGSLLGQDQDIFALSKKNASMIEIKMKELKDLSKKMLLAECAYDFPRFSKNGIEVRRIYDSFSYLETKKETIIKDINDKASEAANEIRGIGLALPNNAWQTQFIGALGDLIASRFKLELMVAFFSEYKKKIQEIEEMQILFPSTKLVLLENDPFNFKAFLPSLRSAFKMDFENMVGSLAEMALKKLDSINNREEVEIAITILKIMQGIKDGKLPAKIIDETGQLFDDHQFNNETVKPIKLLAMLSANLANPETGLWEKKDELIKKVDQLKADKAEFIFFILAVCKKAEYPEVDIEKIDLWISYFSRLFNSIFAVQDGIDLIHKKQISGEPFGFNEFCMMADCLEKMIQNTLALDETGTVLPGIKEKIDQIYEYSRIAKTIYSSYNSGDIGAAGIQILSFIQKVIPKNKFVLKMNAIKKDIQAIHSQGKEGIDYSLFTKIISERFKKRPAEYTGADEDIQEKVNQIVDFITSFNSIRLKEIIPFTREKLNSNENISVQEKECLNAILDPFWEKNNKVIQNEILRGKARTLIQKAQEGMNEEGMKKMLSVYLAKFYHQKNYYSENIYKLVKVDEWVEKYKNILDDEIRVANRSDLIRYIEGQIEKNEIPFNQEFDWKALLKSYFVYEQDYVDNTDLYEKVIKYSNFAVNLLLAKNTGDMQAVLESAVAPVGSYIIKRTNHFSISLNSYTGIFPSLSSFAQKISPDGKLPSFDEEKSEKLSMPFSSTIGFSFDWGGKEKESSISVFAALIDIGSLVSIRLSGNKDEIPPLTLKELWSPGIFVMYGFKNKPYSIGIGAQMGPLIKLTEVERDAVEGGDPLTKIEAVTQTNAFRIGIVLAIDIPLINIIKIKHKL